MNWRSRQVMADSTVRALIVLALMARFCLAVNMAG